MQKHSQLARVILRGGKQRWVATDSDETNAALLKRIGGSRVIKRVNTNPQRKLRSFNPATIASLQRELLQVDRDIAELEGDPFYGETPGRRVYRAKWLAYHRRDRRKIEQMIRDLERAAKRRSNGITEAAAGLQALKYLGGQVKKGGLGRKPKYGIARNPKEDRYLIQVTKATGGREQFTTNSEKQAKDTTASWYSRGASVTVVDRKKKTQTVYGKKNPMKRTNAERQFVTEHHGYKIYFEGSSYSCPMLKLFGYSTERAIKNAIDKILRKRGQLPAKNPRAKGSRDALGVFHAENPRKTLTAVRAAQQEQAAYERYARAYKDWRAGKITLKKLQAMERQKTRASLRRAELLSRGVANPSVTDLSRTFQGDADGSIERMHAAQSAPANLARAGKLVFLKAGNRTFRISGAMVAIAPNEKLWIVGNHAPLFETKAKTGQGLDVGEVTHICYETAKTHIGDGKTFEYVHEFGEDGGKRPHLIIDSEGMPILRGGDYKIRAEGIVN